MRFDTVGKIVQLAIYCMIAAILCGMTGIAGGMVLGPLFLSYNMVPLVMSGTNQYITMIASIAVVVQFMYLDQLNWGYAALCGGIAVLAAFTGIFSINIYVKKSGKQSVITILLIIVLVLALVSLPLKFLVLSPAGSDKAADTKAPTPAPAPAPKPADPKAGAISEEQRKLAVKQIRYKTQVLLD